ncbi:MAG: S-methyl-5-thioribose-1-phosphate isomerase [Bdellovibrionales bacterium RBG_16_40_8]|nr:MAG: S-methyl-5-thioribose-1-phosphate isomerase [Bdellovibrionales bacterium RBG_16_40_8]
MRKFESLALRFDGEKIWVLDQMLLPQKKIWLDATSPEKMIEYIRALKVRGAPLIGIAAAFCLARLAESGETEAEYRKAAESLRASRPTAVNLMNAVDKLTAFRPGQMNVRDIVELAERFFREDQKLCENIAKYGAELVLDGDGIITHCNTGGLATAGVGTAMGIIRRAHEEKKKIHVYIDETRPLLQGGRLTAWEMAELAIPHTLICDSAAAILMREKRITKVIVGCDRIALNGDFANKVGTYGLAVLARHHGIAFYVAGPYTTIDLHCESGADIPIEERAADEVRGVCGAFGEVVWAPRATPVFNPAFDVTPAALVSAWILDKGVYTTEDIKRGGLIECTQS